MPQICEQQMIEVPINLIYSMMSVWIMSDDSESWFGFCRKHDIEIEPAPTFWVESEEQITVLNLIFGHSKR
jgi:hypothetical protein